MMSETNSAFAAYSYFFLHTYNQDSICVIAVFLNVFFKLPILFIFLKLYIFHILYPDVLIKIHLTHHLIHLVITYVIVV